MYAGKTLFAQVMDFLPWSTSTGSSNSTVAIIEFRKLPCTEQFRAMAFAQLTYRESLRDIETCLSAQTAKLYHMGFAKRFDALHWPMPTSLATGASTPISHNG